MRLIVGDLSTWSIRAWLILRLAEVEFETDIIPLGTPETASKLEGLSATKLVPILHHHGQQIHDSLAIAEYLHEHYPDRVLYPDARSDRTLARSLCAELHSGFNAIRKELPFSLDKQETPGISKEVERDLARLDEIFCSASDPFYFNQAGIVDAFYGVMALRLDHYRISLSPAAQGYANQLLDWPLLRMALADQASRGIKP